MPIDIKTNDDASPYSEQPRHTQFLVIEGNDIVIDGHLAVIAFTAANSLIADNHVTGNSQRFVLSNGKWSGTLQDGLIYQYFNNVIKDNVIEASLSFANIEIQSWAEDLEYRYYRIGQVDINNNRFLNGAPLLRLNTTHPIATIESVDVHANYYEGSGGRSVEIVGGGIVEDVTLRENVFVNTARGYDGVGDVLFEDNEWR